MKIYNCIEKDCMMIIIMHGALLSQALTDSARKQCEDWQIVKDNVGWFTCFLALFVFVIVHS